jgi:hypothetical protein
MKQVDILWKLVEQDDYPLSSIGWDPNGKTIVMTVVFTDYLLSLTMRIRLKYMLAVHSVTFSPIFG